MKKIRMNRKESLKGVPIEVPGVGVLRNKIDSKVVTNKEAEALEDIYGVVILKAPKGGEK